MVVVAVLAAFGVAIYVVERLIPFPLPVGRWGLSNYPVLTIILCGRTPDALLILIVKSVVGSMIIGSFLSPQFIMGLGGGICAVLAMRALEACSNKVSAVRVSVTGATVNNVIQVLIASAMVKNWAPTAYLPVLLIVGEISAVANAYLAWKTVIILKEGRFI